MNLAGKFSYKKENQRTLSFNVDILKLPTYKTVFTGSSSKDFQIHIPLIIYYSFLAHLWAHFYIVFSKSLPYLFS